MRNLLFPEKMSGKTALFVGAGAVERAWDPIVSALQHFSPIVINADQASCMLTRSVFLSRFFASYAGPDGVNVSYDLLEKQKFRIAEELKLAEKSGLIRARSDIEWVVNHLLLPRSPVFYVVSTNWDCTVDIAIQNILSVQVGTETKVFHLHGSYIDPASLYLPSEISSEPYRDEFQTQKIGGMHVGLMGALSDLEHLVIYGLSLDPLDAELNQTLAAVIDSAAIKTIEIVDLEPEKVADRIVLLMKNPTLPNIKYIKPINIRKH